MKTPSVPLRRQRGGTFLGFVIGALFGLGLALAVAVYVTKVPIPFINKVQPRPAESDAQKGKDWNPNANLPGRLPPKSETEPAAEPAPEASAPAAPASGTAPAPAARTGDPIGDLAKSRSEAPSRPTPADPPPPAPQAADPFQYFVQAGAFRQADEAEQQRARLLLLGLQARVSEREQAGRMVYRVRLGPFDRRDEADKTLERLEGAGVSAVVVRVQR